MFVYRSGFYAVHGSWLPVNACQSIPLFPRDFPPADRPLSHRLRLSGNPLAVDWIPSSVCSQSPRLGEHSGGLLSASSISMHSPLPPNFATKPPFRLRHFLNTHPPASTCIDIWQLLNCSLPLQSPCYMSKHDSSDFVPNCSPICLIS
jgi:hypothetical protein